MESLFHVHSYGDFRNQLIFYLKLPSTDTPFNLPGKTFSIDPDTPPEQLSGISCDLIKKINTKFAPRICTQAYWIIVFTSQLNSFPNEPDVPRKLTHVITSSNLLVTSTKISPSIVREATDLLNRLSLPSFIRGSCTLLVYDSEGNLLLV